MQAFAPEKLPNLRTEIAGPFLLPNGLERWKVLVFSQHGTLVDTYDAYSEKHALELKEALKAG